MICNKCHNELIGDQLGPHKQCKNCLSAYQKNRRAKLKESGLCIYCGKLTEKGYSVCRGCLSRQKEEALSLKLEVMQFYGGKCSNCGEGQLEFLCIDHENGKGNKHRASLVGNGAGERIYRWLKKSGYPAGYQVLCFNCNHEKGLFPAECKRPLEKQTRERIKKQVFGNYGARCSCCGETNLNKLTIDHILGAKDIVYKEAPRDGDKLYRWIIKKGHPNTFQVLCMNCNFAVSHFGLCPHKTIN
jgi:hypothetical protein